MSVDVQYGAIEKIPMPVGIIPVRNLGGAFVMSNGKKAFGQRFSVMNADGILVTDWVLKSDSGLQCFEGQVLLLPVEKGWGLHDIEGRRISGETYAKAFGLGCNYIAVSKADSKGKYFLTDIHGTQRLDLECDDIRPFANGYTVFTQKKQQGAIDTNGNIIIQQRFSWLSDAEYGLFRFSSIAKPTVNTKMGLINANNQILFNEENGFSDIVLRGENQFIHRIHYQFSIRDNNKETVYDIPATGYYTEGKVINARYLWIGDESEGLRAFASYSQSSPPPLIAKGRFTAGYMDADWNHVIIAADFDIPTGFEFSQLIQQIKDFGARLTPFRGGNATIAIQKSTGSAFMGHDFVGQQRKIDRSGNVLSVTPIPKGQVVQYRILNDNINSSKFEGNMKKIAHKLKGKGMSPLDAEMSCGLVRVSTTKSGLCGYADENGVIVVAPDYKEVSVFSEGTAYAMQPDGKYFILRKKTIY